MKLLNQGKSQTSAISYTIPVLEYTCKSLNEIILDYHEMQLNQVSEAHIFDSYTTKAKNQALIAKLRQKVFSKLQALQKLQSQYNDLIKIPQLTSNQSDAINDEFFNQLKLHCKNDQDYKISCILVESIDQQGYLNHPLETLAQNLNLSIDKIKNIKLVIQSIQPIGITARDFDEYALIFIQSNKDQIIQKHGFKTYQFYINFFTNYSRDFRLSPKKIINDLNISLDQCVAQLKQLQSFGLKLNPITKHQLKKTSPVAELKVTLKNNQLNISSINDLYTYANLKQTDINFYSQAIEGINNPDLLKKISSQLVNSRSQLYAVYIRMDNLYRISKAILSAQSQWFVDGDQSLKALKYQDISDITGISKSVVCRCVNKKYISYQDTLIELKFFFSTGVKDKNGFLHSRVKIKSLIKTLINQENKKRPLSDVKLQKSIESNYNIKLTVRVVAKYRNELKIPDYSSRKIG